VGFFLWCISFGTFLVAQREKYIPNDFIALFSPWREKRAKRAPPKGRTHGPPLWKPHPSSALIFAPRKCLRAVKSALRPSPATGSERHPSRSTCWVATQGYERNGRHIFCRQTIASHNQKVATPATGRPIWAIDRDGVAPTPLRLGGKLPTEQRICRTRASELGSDSRGGGKRTARKIVSKGRNRGFLPLVHLFWYFSRCMTRKVHIKPFCCPFLSLSRERDRKSATKGENPRFSPLETSPLFCAHFRSRENVYALSSRHFVRHPQRGRSDTRRGQLVGLRPKANSQTVGVFLPTREKQVPLP